MGHPIGLAILFFTEMWERFSYYGIRAILIFYMMGEVAKGGLGWSREWSYDVLKVFMMSCYLTTIPGGFVADRWLGKRKSVWLGCLFIMIGNFCLVLPDERALYTGLALIALGGGFLKPNISAIVGRLYKDGDSRRESAFSIFYMGINVGAFFSGIVVGLIAAKWGWRYGFLASGIGMLFGQFLYIWGQRYLKHTDTVTGPGQVAVEEPRQPLTSAEWRRIGVIVFSFLSVIIFWTAFEQSPGLLNLFAEEHTNRMIGSWEMPTAWFQSFNPLYIILLSPLMAMLWPWLAKRGKNPHAIVKMGIGTVIQGLGFFFMVAAVTQAATGKCSMIWLALVYLSCTIGELWLSPVALSFITSTAPKRMTSLIMGCYYAVTGVAGYLAGSIGAKAETLAEYKTVFIWLVIVTTAVGLLQLAFAKKIIRTAAGR